MTRLAAILLLLTFRLNAGSLFLASVKPVGWSGNYFVEQSTDLQTWQRIGAYCAQNPCLVVMDGEAKFFRCQPFLGVADYPRFDDAYTGTFAAQITLNQL